MPHGRKSKGVYDENKTQIHIFCGKTFKGTRSCILRGKRLHLMTCPICKKAVEQGYQGITKEDLDLLPKPGITSLRMGFFSDYTKAIKESMEKTKISKPVVVAINPEDVLKASARLGTKNIKKP